MAESTTKHEAIEFSYPLDLASCTRIIDMGMAMVNYGMHTLMQVYVTICMDDAFILNCRRRPPPPPPPPPTVSMGCEEQVVDAKYTRPFLLL